MSSPSKVRELAFDGIEAFFYASDPPVKPIELYVDGKLN
jgi:hypothetical protein